jgi:hypothetical protein
MSTPVLRVHSNHLEPRLSPRPAVSGELIREIQSGYAGERFCEERLQLLELVLLVRFLIESA